MRMTSDFFEEGCAFEVRATQCAIRSFTKPFKCASSHYFYRFNYFSQYPTFGVFSYS